MSKKNIALVTGGFTGEYVISVASAKTGEKYIDRSKYNVYKIVIDRQKWVCETEDGQEIPVDRSDFTLTIGENLIKFDAVLMILHGSPGEDGKLQSYFDMLGIPYTSCDAATSALTMNKRFTVAVANFGGIKTAKSLHIFKSHPLSIEAILNELTLPVFVKPNSGGSSIGMSRVEKPEDLAAALERGFKEDDQLLVEQFIKGREFTVGVMRTRSEIVVLPIIEIRPKKAFFDFEAKYEGASEELIPAPIDETQANILRGAASKVYQILNCRGIVRIDFIWNEADDQPYMLEVNTVPGQTDASLVPQMVREHGWTMTEFYSRQLEEII
ncbi:MAG: D-alanine--D-alanine ligase [Saprospiraceae bacterium]|nr:D-alanine--D-alanine ligase [Saprospiraceae bacterium]